MFQIDGTNAATVIPTPEAVGPNPNGFFQDADADLGVTATTVSADFLNAIQGEIAYVITQSGATLSKTSRTQLYTAINTLIANYIATNFSNNFTWTTVTTSQTMAVSTGYQTNSGSSINLTLPATAAVGKIIKVARYNGQFVILQNSGQQIHCGTQNTTLGVTGSLTSNQAGAYLELMCTVANTHFMALGNWGNFQTT